MTRSQLAVGAALAVPLDAFSRAGATDAAATLLLATSWCRPLRYLTLGGLPGREFPHRPGVVAAAQRSEVLRRVLGDSGVWELSLATSGGGIAPKSKSYGVCWIQTQPMFVGSDRYLLMHASQWLDTATAARDDALVTEMLRFGESMAVSHGVVPVMDEVAVSAEVGFVGVWERGCLVHPHPAQFHRMRAVKWELGTRYVRFPRWGTIYSRAHVAQLGGVERIREVVRPAVIRELGPEALYFQLTESVATATSEEAVAKERAFTELAAPLLPPPVLAED